MNRLHGEGSCLRRRRQGQTGFRRSNVAFGTGGGAEEVTELHEQECSRVCVCADVSLSVSLLCLFAFGLRSLYANL